MPVGDQYGTWEDASCFFDEEPSMGAEMPETIFNGAGLDENTRVVKQAEKQPPVVFLGPHVAQRPYEITADRIREMGTQETPDQPAQITGGEGMTPQSPIEGQQRGYDYQAEMNPIRKDYQAMMTPVVAEPQREGEPNITVDAVIPPVRFAAGLDYRKPRPDTVYTMPGVSRATPEILPHAGALPQDGDRDQYQHDTELLEGMHGHPDDGVTFNGPGTIKRDMRRTAPEFTINDRETRPNGRSPMSLDSFFTENDEEMTGVPGTSSLFMRADESLGQAPGEATYLTPQKQWGRAAGASTFMEENDGMGRPARRLRRWRGVPGDPTMLLEKQCEAIARRVMAKHRLPKSMFYRVLAQVKMQARRRRRA
jgi:hypothetical protein